MQFTKTLRLKVKPNSYAWLTSAVREVNFVWNWANETSEKAARRFTGKTQWLDGFDLCGLSSGASKETKFINADTIQRICIEYSFRRKVAKKVLLKWRKSSGTRKSLGWVPFKAASIKRKGAGLRFCGKSIRIFERELLDEVQWRDGCFSQDSLGDWWCCLSIRVPSESGQQFGEVGIDLGLKNMAVSSDGERLESGSFYRSIELKIADVQRRGHKRQAKRLHRKAARRRADTIHKFTAGITQRYSKIYVGDVSSTKLVKTRMAKSVLDSGWGMLKTQFIYKCQRAGTEFAIVNERNTTRGCACCGQLTGPSGLSGLSVRAWRCSACGTEHDRDVNAARNILALGLRHQPPSAGMLSSYGRSALCAAAE